MFGTIKKVIKDKGFGFITPDDGTDEVFFHRSRLSPKVYFEDLREGDQVQFDVRQKGWDEWNDIVHAWTAINRQKLKPSPIVSVHILKNEFATPGMLE